MNPLAQRLPGGTHAQGIKRLLGFIALKVGHLLVIHTPWVAVSVASSEAPTLSTAQQREGGNKNKKLHKHVCSHGIDVDAMQVRR